MMVIVGQELRKSAWQTTVDITDLIAGIHTSSEPVAIESLLSKSFKM